LKALEPFAKDRGFLDRWRKTQEASKNRLASYIKETMSIDVDPTSMFDVQVKRLHEYKRQHLNALHILSLYCQIKGGTMKDLAPRTFLFGGKAAPSYTMAKLIIKLICQVGELVNNDPQVKDILKVIFLPNYSVSLGQRIYPAADLSEQISTAGFEASRTGCMKRVQASSRPIARFANIVRIFGSCRAGIFNAARPARSSQMSSSIPALTAVNEETETHSLLTVA
jgi:starch phosphorylase